MIESNHYGPLLVTLVLLSIGVPLISSSGITGHATDIGGVEVSTTTGFLLGILVVCGLILLFYGKSGKFNFATRRIRNFKHAYNPHSDVERIRLYIKSRLDANESKQKIKNSLLKVGWESGLIEQAFTTIDQIKPIVPKKRIKPRKK
jgi:hypothetical protein